MGNHREGQQSIQNLHWVLRGPAERCWETAACSAQPQPITCSQGSAQCHHAAFLHPTPNHCTQQRLSLQAIARETRVVGGEGAALWLLPVFLQHRASPQSPLDENALINTLSSNQGRWSWQKKPPPASNCFCKPLTSRVLLRGCGCKVPLSSYRENKRYFLHTSITCS